MLKHHKELNRKKCGIIGELFGRLFAEALNSLGRSKDVLAKSRSRMTKMK